MGTPQTSRGGQPRVGAVRPQLRAVRSVVGRTCGRRVAGPSSPSMPTWGTKPRDLPKFLRTEPDRLQETVAARRQSDGFIEAASSRSKPSGRQMCCPAKTQQRQAGPGVQARVHREPEIFQGHAPLHADAVQNRRKKPKSVQHQPPMPGRSHSVFGTACSPRLMICSRCAG